MNDFTKEELEYIFYCVDIVTNKNDEHDIYEKLENKIQFMIDTYCDHDCKATIWQCQVTACSKCGFPSTVIKANK